VNVSADRTAVVSVSIREENETMKWISLTKLEAVSMVASDTQERESWVLAPLDRGEMLKFSQKCIDSCSSADPVFQSGSATWKFLLPRALVFTISYASEVRMDLYSFADTSEEISQPSELPHC